MFALVVRFDLRDDEAAAAFDALLAETLPLIAEREPGTLVYATHRVEGEPLVRVFYEVYVDRAAHARHEAAPHTARFLAEKEPYLTGARVEFLSAPVGPGRPVTT
jgi:quinol monooxygenase YgiN